MKFVISGKNLEVSEGLRNAVEDKLGKLDKYFSQDTKCIVTLSVERDRQKVEVTIPVKGNIIRSEQVSNDMYVSIDLVEEVIEQNVESFQKAYLEKEYDQAEDELSITRVKRFEIKPMYPEDACVQMELLGHSFFVFVNAETDETNVVYRRKGGTYGLIEPDV